MHFATAQQRSVFSASLLSAVSAAAMCTAAWIAALVVCAFIDKAAEATIPSLVLFAGLFGGCAGAATFLPRGHYRWTSSLAIIFFTTLLVWFVVVLPYAESLNYRRSQRQKGDDSVAPVTIAEERSLIGLYLAVPLGITTVLTGVRLLFPELAGSPTEQSQKVGGRPGLSDSEPVPS